MTSGTSTRLVAGNLRSCDLILKELRGKALSGSNRTRVALYGGVLFAILAAIAAVAGDRGTLDRVFRNAWHDSSYTELTAEVASVLNVRKNSENVVDFIEDNGFACQRSMLNANHNTWLCQRQTWNWAYLAYERWTLEFQCDAKFPDCTIAKHYAAVESRSWQSFL